ncbi:MAG: DEAD/DEAH box helicase, partial [Spirochaetota bacterium]
MDSHAISISNDPLTVLAKKHFHIDYLFPYQRLVISNILEAAGVPGFAPEPGTNPLTGEPEVIDTKPHQIVILPTGAGKSLCFMLPASLLEGPTLVIFPLLSLIADQARRLIEAGMKPGILRGGQSRTEREAVWKDVKSGKSRMILTNPETVLHPPVLAKLKELNIKHLVIDETHIVSEWGETFRPVYLDIRRIAAEASVSVVTAFTATASPIILEKIKAILFPDTSPNIVFANPDRPNIRYSVIPTLSKDHTLTELFQPGSPRAATRPALIFCRSRSGAEMTAHMLRERTGEKGIYFYHAGLEKEEKAEIEKWFFPSQDGVLASTCAYGMGVDKPDIRTVIHRDIPPS